MAEDFAPRSPWSLAAKACQFAQHAARWIHFLNRKIIGWVEDRPLARSWLRPWQVVELCIST